MDTPTTPNGVRCAVSAPPPAFVYALSRVSPRSNKCVFLYTSPCISPFGVTMTCAFHRRATFPVASTSSGSISSSSSATPTPPRDSHRLFSRANLSHARTVFPSSRSADADRERAEEIFAHASGRKSATHDASRARRHIRSMSRRLASTSDVDVICATATRARREGVTSSMCGESRGGRRRRRARIPASESEGGGRGHWAHSRRARQSVGTSADGAS